LSLPAKALSAEIQVDLGLKRCRLVS
jgi:hypothetical protein